MRRIPRNVAQSERVWRSVATYSRECAAFEGVIRVQSDAFPGMLRD